jgi:hypothetical protein
MCRLRRLPSVAGMALLARLVLAPAACVSFPIGNGLTRKRFKMKIRGLLIFLAAAIASFALIPTASASPPQVEQFRFVGVDDTFSEELTNACGFPVTVTVDAHETHLFFEDRGQFSIHYNATVSGNGNTLLLRNNVLEIDTAESVTVVGVPFRVLNAEGKTLVKDAGFLYFSFEDGTLVLHGPHPGLSFDLCAALR